MKLPALLLRFLPLWSYICPRCKREVKRNSHKCPFCGEKYGKPLKVPPLFLKNEEALEKYVHEKIFPRISAKQREYLAQFFTTIFEDGFESGDFSAWDGTTVTAGEADLSVQSTEKYQGGYGADAYIHYTSSWWLDAYCYKNFGSTYTKLHARAYFKFTDFPVSAQIESVLELRKSGDWPYVVISIGVKADGNAWYIQYTDNGSKQSEEVSDTIQTDTWYCLEIMGDTSNGELEVWKDGSSIWSKTGVSSLSGINQLYAGVIYGYRGTYHVYFDCVVVADTYIGEEGGVTEVQISDYASGNETLSRPYRDLSLTDQASGQDIFSRPYREIPISELTLGQELLLKTRSLSLSDIATSLEVIQKGKQLGAITDVAQGLEQILKQRLISLLDQAAGFESIVRPTRVIVMADEALGREILSKLREVAAIADSAIGVEYINVGTEEAKKTKIFLLIGDLAIQVTGD